MAANESDAERLNRKLIELLNELRVVLPGVQVLFAFLLVLPFNSGFSKITRLERNVYVATLLSTAVASILLIAPSCYHRLRFHRLNKERPRQKREMLVTQDHLAVGGLVFLTASMMGAIFVTLAVLVGSGPAAIVCGMLGAAFVWFWFGLPLSRRLRDPDHSQLAFILDDDDDDDD